jgi:hypothetical protein
MTPVVAYLPALAAHLGALAGAPGQSQPALGCKQSFFAARAIGRPTPCGTYNTGARA